MKDAVVSAKHLTNDRMSVAVHVLDDKSNTILADLTINKARQIDVVDEINMEFRSAVMNSIDSTISFPDTPSRIAQKSREQYTRKQGQYLAFIYYYTKLSRRPPAEVDMQRYSRTAPPTVHNMVVLLERW